MLPPLLPCPGRGALARRAAAGLAALLACAGPALAQPALPDEPAPQGLAGREIAFEADQLSYDSGTDTVSATGHVLLVSGDQSLRADSVSWNRLTGQIAARGNVRLVDQNGNQLFTEEVELDEELRAGAMTSLLLAFRQGARLAADQARRDAAGNVVLETIAFSSCAVVDGAGCPRNPSWRLTADRVVYDAATQRISFRGAWLELFGARILPLPGLALRADGGPSSGFFIPDIALTASNGIELSQGYYWRLAGNRDLTATAYVYTDTAPMVQGQYRELTGTGAWQASVHLTHGSRIPLGSEEPVQQDALRYYLAANGRFQLNPALTLSGSIRLASDRTFLRRYDISREDRIRSTLAAERIDAHSFLSVAGWATQALLVSTEQGQVPLALPLLDYRLRLPGLVAGGRTELQFNTLAISRAEGQDTRRAFARARWDLRRITPFGQEVVLTGLLRGDLYHSDNTALTLTPAYRGTEGWQARGVALGAIDVKWPLIGQLAGGTLLLAPRVQLVATPELRNLAIPNEDARSIDLEDSNLFALNRFPGHDRVEDGVRVTYGADANLTFPGWRISTTIGQSWRLNDRPNLFPDGTGLSEQWSDFVGRTEVRYRDFLKFTHRFRLDKDSLAVRRNEIDATVGSDSTYIEVGYLRLDRNIDFTLEDLQDREEIRAAGRWAFSRHWSLFGSAVINLTDRDEDPLLASDGFEPLRTRLGIAYADDCLEFGFTWRRDYVRLADAQSGSSFRIHFALRNLSLR